VTHVCERVCAREGGREGGVWGVGRTLRLREHDRGRVGHADVLPLARLHQPRQALERGHRLVARAARVQMGEGVRACVCVCVWVGGAWAPLGDGGIRGPRVRGAAGCRQARAETEMGSSSASLQEQHPPAQAPQAAPCPLPLPSPWYLARWLSLSAAMCVYAASASSSW
jgi:hypothetical protein